MSTCATVFTRGDRVRCNAGWFSRCTAKEEAFYRDREGTILGGAIDGQDGLYRSCNLKNWFRVQWDRDGSDYRMMTAVNLEHVPGGG